jgi:hypothetical protein
MPSVRWQRDGEEEVTDDPEQGPEPEERIVPFIRVRCNKCRRAVSREMDNARKGGAGLPRIERTIGICPHYKTVWAPGMGPGTEPPEDPTTPEERRRGAV